jgi:hypothetical protein
MDATGCYGPREPAQQTGDGYSEQKIMKETQLSRRIGRSTGALLIGIFAGAILSFGTDELLHIAGIFPALGRPMMRYS